MLEKPRTRRIFGLSIFEVSILLGLIILLCLVLSLGIFIFYSGTFTPQAVAIQPTYTPYPTYTSIPKPLATLVPIQPSPISSPLPSRTPAPTIASQIGTFNNPVPIGIGYNFIGLGTFTVIKSSWLPGQTGLAIVELSFSCERPTGQECSTIDFSLDVVGGSGNGYSFEYFDPDIPEPRFGGFMNPPVYGGGIEKGYVGFLIKNNESTLVMRNHFFYDKVYFKISY